MYNGCLAVRVGGDHRRGWGWLNVLIFRDYYWPTRSVTRQQEGPMFSYSLYIVCCLYVTFLLPLERATKAGPCHLFIICLICLPIIVSWLTSNITILNMNQQVTIHQFIEITINLAFYGWIRVDKQWHQIWIKISTDRNSHTSDWREGGCHFYFHMFQWEFDIFIHQQKIHQYKVWVGSFPSQ